MDIYEITIEVAHKPIDQILSSDTKVSLDFDELIEVDLISEITLEDIEVQTQMEDVEEFEDLDFEYDDTEYDALDNIDFDFEQPFE